MSNHHSGKEVNNHTDVICVVSQLEIRNITDPYLIGLAGIKLLIQMILDLLVLLVVHCFCRLPYALDIDMLDAMVPEQTVEDFQLGMDLGDIHGKYTVYAPFSFKGGSDVMYRETVDGWNSEELDNLVIKVLEVSGVVTSELPLEFDLYGHPIDKDGNIHEEVDIEGARILAEAKETPFTMRISGEISHLDGIEFLVMAIADDSGITLSPDLKIYLKDLKVKVSGNYVDEL